MLRYGHDSEYCLEWCGRHMRGHEVQGSEPLVGPDLRRTTLMLRSARKLDRTDKGSKVVKLLPHPKPSKVSSPRPAEQ
jgi:hypothetical protein